MSSLQVVVFLLVSFVALALGDYPAPFPESSHAAPYVPGPLVEGCGHGKVLRLDGACVYPIVHRNVFMYHAPPTPKPYHPPPSLPKPEVHHNIVFIRAPEPHEDPKPIVVPPPRYENIVYVLNKLNHKAQKVVKVPVPPQEAPQVYFVNYEDDGDFHPGGIDLKGAIDSSVHREGVALDVVDGAGVVGVDAVGLETVTGAGLVDAAKVVVGGDVSVGSGDVDYDLSRGAYDPHPTDYDPPVNDFITKAGSAAPQSLYVKP